MTFTCSRSEWEPQQIRLYVDGNLYATDTQSGIADSRTSWPFRWPTVFHAAEPGGGRSVAGESGRDDAISAADAGGLCEGVSEEVASCRLPVVSWSAVSQGRRVCRLRTAKVNIFGESCIQLLMATEKAVLGGGCFWCVEAAFVQLEGVESVRSGYMGGRRPNPTYEQVCTGVTGHVEVAEITFDPAKISYPRSAGGVFYGPRSDDAESSRQRCGRAVPFGDLLPG